MKVRMMKWLTILSMGTCMALGAGGCLPEDFWPAFVGDTIITGVGGAILASVLGTAGL